MSRKKVQKPAENNTVTIDGETLSADSKAADKLNLHLIEIDSQYGDGVPYDPQRIISETRFYLNQSAEAMLEAGKRLVILKEHEQHGSFTNMVEKIGLPSRTARQMMQAAIKYCDPKRSALAILGKTKMFELMIEDDDALDELAEGGFLHDLSLDDIDRMTTRELKTALREEKVNHKNNNDTHEMLLIKKDEKINEMDKALHNVTTHDDAHADSLSQQIERETTIAIAAFLGPRKALLDVIDWPDAPNHLRAAAAHAVQRIKAALHETLIDIDLDDPSDIDDDWMTEAEQAS